MDQPVIPGLCDYEGEPTNPRRVQTARPIGCGREGKFSEALSQNVPEALGSISGLKVLNIQVTAVSVHWSQVERGEQSEHPYPRKGRESVLRCLQGKGFSGVLIVHLPPRACRT